MNAMLNRRQFVEHGLGMIGLAATVPGFLSRTVQAMTDPSAGAAASAGSAADNDRVLVVLQLAGGNDGLNTVVPYRNDDYYRARPELGIQPDDVLKLNDLFGLHPAADGFRQLYDAGMLAVVQGVGYPNPNRSHFVSTDIWATADPKRRTHTGWIGRYLDNQCRGADPPDPKLAIALHQESPLSLKGETFTPLTFTDANRLRWQPHRTNHGAEEVFNRLIEKGDTKPEPDRLGRRRGDEPALQPIDYLRRVAVDARRSGETIRRATGADALDNRGRRRRGGLNAQLNQVARMIAADLPTRIYYVSLNGFDTHANQAGRHRQLIEQLGNGLVSFFAKLKSMQQLDRVVLMTFSEFGRRVAENASGGTDHGAAAPLFLIGTRVHAGIHGQHPCLERLDKGDLRFTTDFRSVYADVLTRWLGADAKAIVGGQAPASSLIDV